MGAVIVLIFSSNVDSSNKMNTQTKLAQSAVLYECTMRTSNFTTIQQPGTLVPGTYND
jgi:hypothetical protein